jgi:hypothetical protein
VANGESLAVILDRAFGISDPIDATTSLNRADRWCLIATA